MTSYAVGEARVGALLNKNAKRDCVGDNGSDRKIFVVLICANGSKEPRTFEEAPLGPW
jgi:hypothetical protein